jgi:hypothetical protein
LQRQQPAADSPLVRSERDQSTNSVLIPTRSPTTPFPYLRPLLLKNLPPLHRSGITGLTANDSGDRALHHHHGLPLVEILVSLASPLASGPVAPQASKGQGQVCSEDLHWAMPRVRPKSGLWLMRSEAWRQESSTSTLLFSPTCHHVVENTQAQACQLRCCTVHTPHTSPLEASTHRAGTLGLGALSV